MARAGEAGRDPPTHTHAHTGLGRFPLGRGEFAAVTPQPLAEHWAQLREPGWRSGPGRAPAAENRQWTRKLVLSHQSLWGPTQSCSQSRGQGGARRREGMREPPGLDSWTRGKEEEVPGRGGTGWTSEDVTSSGCTPSLQELPCPGRRLAPMATATLSARHLA